MYHQETAGRCMHASQMPPGEGLGLLSHHMPLVRRLHRRSQLWVTRPVQSHHRRLRPTTRSNHQHVTVGQRCTSVSISSWVRRQRLASIKALSSPVQ